MLPNSEKTNVNRETRSDRDGRYRDAPVPVSELRSAIKGRVIAPEDPEFDTARTVFYGGFDRRPAAILRVKDAEDVAQIVTLARKANVPLAIRSGGHSLAGHSASEGGIVLDLKDMRAIQIDAEHRTAWAETGLTAGEYLKAAGESGLATGFGDTGSVGIGGITLGGGVGFLVRKYGLTVDNLLAADVVTADGKIRRVDADNHPDLFWAIRGGGGNFGVATAFKFQLQPVDQILGGMLILPATPETIAAFTSAAMAAPEELSTIANVMPAPPMPFLPPEVHGKLIIMGMMVYAGPVEDGQRAIAPFRAIAKPLADMVRPMRYPEMFPAEESGYHPTAVGRTMYVDRFDRGMAETALAFLQNSDSPIRVTQIRVLGGAAARVPGDATAYAHRQAPIMVNLAAFVTSPDDRPAREAWATEFMAALDQGYPGTYVNFMDGNGSVRTAYPDATYRRLVEIKKQYDPTNLFRQNHNIAPEG